MLKRVLLGFARLLSTVLWVVLLSQMPAVAQETSADILGTVSDPSGAVVPGVAVKLTNLGTQITQGTTSNSVGDYVFSLLMPGKYSLSVTAPGFKTVVIPMIALAAGDRNRENAVLATGGANETVTVTADAPLLQRETSSLTSVVNRATRSGSSAQRAQRRQSRSNSARRECRLTRCHLLWKSPRRSSPDLNHLGQRTK